MTSEKIQKEEAARIKLSEEESSIVNDSETAPEFDSLLGTTINDRFEILSRIGSGGMSTVYKAKHLLMNKIVAIKAIHPSQINGKAIMRFQQEAKAATALNHPNIATVREFGQDEIGRPYLVMDYIEGRPLSELVKERGRLEGPIAISIIEQVCNALQHAHNHGVIHRDIKPSNIMITTGTNGSVEARLLDFGIAKLFEPGGDEGTNLTQTGEVFGTPNYMSPEQCLGRKPDARSDIYSLGCLMFEIVYGRTPFQAESSLQTLMKHLNELPKPLASAKVSSNLEEIILRCLEKSPDKRYQSVELLQKDLELIDKPARLKRVAKRHSSFKPKHLFIAASLIGLTFVLIFLVAGWPAIQPKLFPTPVQNLINEGDVQFNIGPANFESARSKYLPALAMADQLGAPDSEKAHICYYLGRIYTESKDTANARKYFLEAVTLAEKYSPDRLTGSMEDWLGDNYLATNEYALALPHAERGVAIKRKTLGDEHLYTLLAMLHLGQAYLGTRHLPEAEKTNQECVVLAHKLYPKEDEVLNAEAYRQLAETQKLLNKDDDSISNYKKALSIYHATVGTDSTKFRDCLADTTELMRSINRSAQATELKRTFRK